MIGNWHDVRATRAHFFPTVELVIYRRDLVEHYSWLKGSRYLDEFFDESVIAIAMTAHGQERCSDA